MSMQQFIDSFGDPLSDELLRAKPQEYFSQFGIDARPVMWALLRTPSGSDVKYVWLNTFAALKSQNPLVDKYCYALSNVGECVPVNVVSAASIVFNSVFADWSCMLVTPPGRPTQLLTEWMYAEIPIFQQWLSGAGRLTGNRYEPVFRAKVPFWQKTEVWGALHRLACNDSVMPFTGPTCNVPGNPIEHAVNAAMDCIRRVALNRGLEGVALLAYWQGVKAAVAAHDPEQYHEDVMVEFVPGV